MRRHRILRLIDEYAALLTPQGGYYPDPTILVKQAEGRERVVAELTRHLQAIDLSYSLGDLADRLTILALKRERIDRKQFDKEYRAVKKAWDANLADAGPKLAAKLDSHRMRLARLNAHIWDLESDIREGREKKLPGGLREVGRRAILIRESNRQRVETKNAINALSKTGFPEVKSTW